MVTLTDDADCTAGEASENVSEDEAVRRAKRRERNRVAAARCRQRRQDQIEGLQERVNALTRDGDEMRSRLHSLDLEKARLSELVKEHSVSEEECVM
ncbi:unnamed protein product [Protopolystoma xenopodis]|uniref:BZIP domain-containing protein n=1 Tax=Protopolystoma xenopodis TaxID=117903 RepID=A0A448WIQ8_9PLAT|nr:unnamed protein product [Protopolystoma xenopodis]